MEILSDIKNIEKTDGNNKIIGEPVQFEDSEVIFKGKNCVLEFGKNVRLTSTIFRFDCDNGYCYIGDNSQYTGTIRMGLDCSVKIGKDLTVTYNCYISTAENTSVEIGDDCMFASFNEIRCDDAHPIFDVKTGRRMNLSKSIVIGDHVWLAAYVTLLAGASVKSGSVIGYRSLVKNRIPNNCIAAGTPAKVIKEDVAWDKSHLNLTYPHKFPDSDSIENKIYWDKTVYEKNERPFFKRVVKIVRPVLRVLYRNKSILKFIITVRKKIRV